MSLNKKKWKSLEELIVPDLTTNLTHDEFSEESDLLDDSALELKTTRRDFLKIMGFSTAAVTLAACESPIIKSIPYVVKPDDINPGVPNFYSSSFYDGYDYCNVVIKTREGRPIKIYPNNKANYFSNTNCRIQASILSLYDIDKIKNPLVKFQDGLKDIGWEQVDSIISKKITKIGNKKIVLLTPSLPSFSFKKMIKEIKSKYDNFDHIIYDQISYSNALNSCLKVYGERKLPLYDFSNISLLVSFNSDFCSDYNINNLHNTYAKAKKPGKNMLRHIQLESNMSLTGANADIRYPLRSNQIYTILLDIYNNLLNGKKINDNISIQILNQIKKYGDKSLVLVDGDEESYYMGYMINKLIKSKGICNRKLLLKEYDDNKFKSFLNDCINGDVGLLISYNTNLLYSYRNKDTIHKCMSNINYKVSISEKINESSSIMDMILPCTSEFESWGDYNPIDNVYSLKQPTIRKIFNSRQFEENLMLWFNIYNDNNSIENSNMNFFESKSRQKISPYYNYIKNNWEHFILKNTNLDFKTAIYNGYLELPYNNDTNYSDNIIYTIEELERKVEKKNNYKWEIHFYTKSSMGDGVHANNPWLQEMPDPITRVSWDNYLTINPNDAVKFDIKIQDNYNVHNGRMQFYGDYLDIKIGDSIVKNIPVFIQPGQALGTLGLAFGYGHSNYGKTCNKIGVNAYDIYNGNFFIKDVEVYKSNLSSKHEFACIQQQATLMGRYEIAREVSLEDYLNKPKNEWNSSNTMHSWRGEVDSNEVDLWDSFDRSTGHHFNLSIDMNSCIGCGACVIACQAENNIPTVGKEQIRMSRDMYWLRIDRYYSDVTYNEDGGKLTLHKAITHDNQLEPQQYNKLIKPEAINPDVIFQPVMCQHCNHAPCETVCPVGATSHGKQGQNMMAYNRCVGTRYCANNCPYKVRRFNWFNWANNKQFDYHMNNDIGRMVLNPDVVVRSRGVIEKCSFCIQQTQYIILKAKNEGRKPTESEFNSSVACVSACGSNALKFGDINNKDNNISNMLKDKRSYYLLEEIGTKPNVFYQVKVRNRKKK